MHNLIDSYCETRAITRGEFARRLNVSPVTLGNAAAGKVPLAVQIYARMARELGVTIEALVGDQCTTVSKGLGRRRAPKR